MATDISNLYHLIFLAQGPPDCHIGRVTSLEVAMMAVIPELAIMRPVRLNRTGEPYFSQQELKGLINTFGQSLKLLADINS
jgi:hypothetical protein